MTFGRYVLGVAALACALGSLGLAATGLRARLLPTWRGALARLVEVILGFALLIGICEVVGTLGLFGLGPVVAVSMAVGLGLWWSSRPARAVTQRSPASRSRALPLAAALLASGLVLARWAGPTLRAYDQGMLGLDSLWYHMPWAAWYAQTGQVAALHLTDVQYLTAFYPASGELLQGLGIVLMGNDVLSPGFNLVCLGLLLMAGWCLGGSRGVGAATATGAGLAMAVPALTYSQPGSADTDVLGVFFLIAAVALWINSERDEERAALAIAGLAAGLAVSVRLNLLPVVLGLSVGVIVCSPSGQRLVRTAIWLGTVILAGGFWYARNLFAIGNPFPWFGHGILPTPHPALMDNTELSVWHYLTNGAVWTRFFIPDLGRALGPLWVAIVAIALGGALLCLAFGPGRTVRLIGLITLFSFLGYLLTPGSAATAAGRPLGFLFNLRYAAPALTLGLAAAPLAAPLRIPRARWVTFGVLATILAVTLVSDRPLMLAYVPGAVIVAILLLLVGLGLASARGLRALTLRRWAVLLAGTLVVVAAGGAGGYAAQRNYLRGRYASSTGLRSVDRLWRWVRNVHHVHIAIGGTLVAEFQYPLWGAEHSNDVDYIAAHGPAGSFTPIASCQEWRRALNAGHYRYVITSRAVNPVSRVVSFSPEYGWTRRDPGARLLTSVPSHSWVQIFEIARPLDPQGCEPPKGL